MIKKNNLGLLILLLTVIQCGCNKNDRESSPLENSNSINNLSSDISDSTNPYGELIIPDMTIFTNFPDTPQPTFTNPEYISEIEYTIVDETSITFENGYFIGNGLDSTIVEAKTEYHTTSFEVTSYDYKDAKKSFYLNRVAEMEKKWLEDGKPTDGTLFIGDSFFDTEFWSDFYDIFDGNTYTHGVSSSTTTDWEIFSSRLVFPVKPKNIVMHLGTNNLYDDKELPETCIENTKRLLETIHKRLPETNIYYFAIEPRTYGIGEGSFTQTSYNKISRVNLDMKIYCNNNDYLTFVDATSYCYTSGITVNSNFFRDGCHPKLSNYSVYINLLKEAGLELNLKD